jgi:hypothetical protein
MHIELVSCPPLVLILLLMRSPQRWPILLQKQHYLDVVTKVEKWGHLHFLMATKTFNL